uniref:Uncharacterized protein n=1 Tax=Cacopsylla melanoneura TaxID=428564 RepID=A0A8D8ZFD2_9HEMI
MLRSTQFTKYDISIKSFHYVSFPTTSTDNPEEKAKQSRQQIHEFIVNNRTLIEMKRKEREDELKRDEDNYRRQMEEHEREEREEERKREEEKLALMKHRQLHVDYLSK